jgi:CHAD domain-containing protein
LASQNVKLESFMRRYQSLTSQLTRRLSQLLNGLTPDGVHDLRVNARRVQMMVKLLPKEVRDTKYARRFEDNLKILLDDTSKLRDADTLLRTLDPYKGSLSPVLFMSVMKSRKAAEATAAVAIKKSSNLLAPAITQSGLDEKRLTRRLRRKINKQGKIVSSLLRKVVRSEDKVKELHGLRLKLKKLRYLLEIADGRAQALDILPEWQDMLGGIHDLDFAIAYLEHHAKESSSEITGELRRARHMEYERFLSLSRVDPRRAPEFIR